MKGLGGKNATDYTSMELVVGEVHKESKGNFTSLGRIPQRGHVLKRE